MTASEMADREMKRMDANAREMLRDAAQSITGERAALARVRVKELFDNAPWLAAAASDVPGCLHLRYCDLYALAVLTAEPEQK